MVGTWAKCCFFKKKISSEIGEAFLYAKTVSGFAQVQIVDKFLISKSFTLLRCLARTPLKHYRL